MAGRIAASASTRFTELPWPMIKLRASPQIGTAAIETGRRSLWAQPNSAPIGAGISEAGVEAKIVALTFPEGGRSFHDANCSSIESWFFIGVSFQTGL